jgi:hypothetical protein
MSTPTKDGPPSDWERRQAFRLASAVTDIHAARETALLADANVRDLSSRLWRPLHDAIVVSYARPFTQNNVHGSLPKRFATFDDRLRQRLHDDILELRDRQVAHSDGDMRQVVIIPAGVSYFGRIAESTNHAVSDSVFEPDWFAAIAGHCQLLGVDLFAELRSELNRIFDRPDTPRYPFDVLTGLRMPHVGQVPPLQGDLGSIV